VSAGGSERYGEDATFKRKWGGIASFSLALPVMWTEACTRGFTAAHCRPVDGEGRQRLAGCE